MQHIVVDLEEPRSLRPTIAWAASVAMRHPAYQLLRIPLPRTPVNRAGWAALWLAVEVLRLLQAAQPVYALPVFVGYAGHQQLARVRVSDLIVVFAFAYGEKLQLFARVGHEGVRQARPGREGCTSPASTARRSSPRKC